MLPYAQAACTAAIVFARRCICVAAASAFGFCDPAPGMAYDHLFLGLLAIWGASLVAISDQRMLTAHIQHLLLLTIASPVLAV
jgi:hypothetical protein